MVMLFGAFDKGRRDSNLDKLKSNTLIDHGIDATSDYGDDDDDQLRWRNDVIFGVQHASSGQKCPLLHGGNQTKTQSSDEAVDSRRAGCWKLDSERRHYC